MGVELPVSRALSKAFPTSHYHLRNSETSNSIEGVLVPSLWGSRTDQILASQAFDFELDDDPDVERILMSLSLLAGNEFLTAEQRKQAEDYLVGYLAGL